MFLLNRLSQPQHHAYIPQTNCNTELLSFTNETTHILSQQYVTAHCPLTTKAYSLNKLIVRPFIHSFILLNLSEERAKQQQFSAAASTLNFTTLNLITTSKRSKHSPLFRCGSLWLIRRPCSKGYPQFPSPVLCQQCLWCAVNDRAYGKKHCHMSITPQSAVNEAES